MNRYLKKAARHKKWAVAEIVFGGAMFFIGLVFASLIDSPDEAISMAGFLSGILCLAVTGICLRAFYEDVEASKRWQKRNQQHKELMYISALCMAIEEANK